LGKIIPRAIKKSKIPPPIPMTACETPSNLMISSPKKVKMSKIPKAISISRKTMLLCLFGGNLAKSPTKKGMLPIAFITKKIERVMDANDVVISFI